MLTEEMKNVLIIKGYTEDEVETEIENALEKIKPQGVINASFIDNEHTELQNSVTEVEIPNVDRNATSTHGLVINGHSLVHALNQDMKLKFLELASQCTAVICCRVTP
uniref:Uncharacterized protein n=1 Tax=Ciona savignyi TaxID=51511 RepID=H2YBJ9_CIOSA